MNKKNRGIRNWDSIHQARDGGVFFDHVSSRLFARFTWWTGEGWGIGEGELSFGNYILGIGVCSSGSRAVKRTTSFLNERWPSQATCRKSSTVNSSNTCPRMLNKLERHASARINHVLSRIRDHHSTELDINHVVLQSSFLPKKKDFPLIFELASITWAINFLALLLD